MKCFLILKGLSNMIFLIHKNYLSNFTILKTIKEKNSLEIKLIVDS